MTETHSHADELVVQEDPREEVDESDAAREESHHDGDVQSANREDEQVVGQNPHEAEEGTPSQELDRRDALGHQVIQALAVRQAKRGREREREARFPRSATRRQSGRGKEAEGGGGGERGAE